MSQILVHQTQMPESKPKAKSEAAPEVEAEADERWMKVALREADAAAAHADVPIGCVIVGEDGRELARGRNRREIDADPTAHAEMVAMRAAARGLGHWRLDGATLYVTLEPCVMCAGALVNARIMRVVYGATDPKAGAVKTLYQVTEDPRLNHRVASTGGVLGARCAERLRSFFRVLREQGEK